MRIWLDTDLGSDVDDALALAYALRHPEIELVGVSTVFGDVGLRTRIAVRLLDIAGRSEIPVRTGLGKPLTEARQGVMFGHEGLGLFEHPEPQLRTTGDTDGQRRIAELGQAIERARPDALVAIGPLTNLGALARAGVTLPRLAIMGGKLVPAPLPGANPQIEEWNWWCDPKAVQEVLGARHVVPPRVVPAEVTFRTSLAPGDVDRLGEGDDLARALAALCREWMTAQVERLHFPKAAVLLHDPLTVATLVHESLCRFETRRAQIDDAGRTTCGAGHEVEAAVDVDPAATRSHLMETWLSPT